MAKTERGEYRCVAKQGYDGQPYLLFVQYSADIPAALTGKILSIDLRPGTILLDARAVADALDRLMVGLAVTD